jgi:hypothetical protein
MADRDKIQSLTTRPQKKAKAKLRHACVAENFTEWLAAHPNVSHKRKFDTFDSFCDAAWVKQVADTFNEAFDEMNEKLTNAR